LAFALASCGTGAVQRRLVGRRVDAEQRLAGAHLAAFAEQALLHDAGDARTHLRRAQASTRPGSSVSSGAVWVATVMTPTSGGGGAPAEPPP
jgi:hypothetical protein